VKLSLFAFRLGQNWRSYGPASMGEINEENATLVAPRTWRYVYREEGVAECSITFTFSPDQVAIGETGTCAVKFGYGVSAVGNWDRICAGSNGNCGETPSGRYRP
jgi:hypothetical protein